jgi:putative FmdB family regulatory protein
LTIRRDLRCNACKQIFEVRTKGSLKDKSTCCPHCGSKAVRQTLASYLRNGPLLDPEWANRCHSTYG